jgi:hypothetical protein
MSITLKTAKDQDLKDLDKRVVREEGLYQFAVTSQELKEAKSTQGMGELGLKQLTVADDPDSASGSSLTFRVMFPDIGDEKVFQKKLVDDGKVKDDETPESVMADRKKMAAKGVRDVGVALAGYENLPPVPRWSREDKCFLYADGTTATKAEKDAAIEARNQAAYDFAVGVFTGETDVTRYVVYGNIKHREFNGQTQEEIGYLRCQPPMDAKILGLK